MQHTTIVIPYHSGRTFLRVCVESLLRTTDNGSSIIIVHNGPGDEGLKDEYECEKIRVISLGRAVGYSAAVNIGVSEVQTEFVALCDADTAYPAPWLGNHIRYHEQHSRTGVTGSKLLDSGTGHIIDFGIEFNRHTHFHPYFDRKLITPAAGKTLRPQAVCSANVVFRRQTFERVGGFDENYKHLFQDVDFCLRLKSLGYMVAVLPESTAFHQSAVTPINKSVYRSDMMGFHVAKHAASITSAVEKYIFSEIDFLFHNRSKENLYNLIDLSSVTDPSEYISAVRRRLNVEVIGELPAPERDIHQITLMRGLSHAILADQNPVIYFVDRFRSLSQNVLWFSQRRNKSDIIVDRHCNVVCPYREFPELR